MIPAIEKLQSLINIYQPDAEILLFMTHGYYNGTTTSVNGESKLLSATQLQQYIQMSYTYIGNKLGLRVVPCGLAFARCQQLYPDMTILGTDNKHPNYLGYFLDAVCFYKAIFGKMPENTDIVPDGCKVTSEEMLKLYNAADGQLQLNTISHIMKIGDTYQLDAVLMDTTDANVTWKSLSSSIVSVSSTGLLTAKKAGSTLIIAQSESGLQDICYVTVEEEALYNAGIIFSTESHIVEQKDNLKITPAISTMLADDTITWSSSSKTIASVSSDGTVTANAPGKAVITATDKKAEKSASYTIYVRLTAPKKISIKTVATSSNKATEANVKISWSAVASAKSYVVYRSTSKNGEYTAIGTTTAKSYTDKKITTGKNYYYRVSAANTYSSCESSKSTVYARVIAPTTPTISKTSATTKKIKITWSRKTSATGYIIYRSTNNGKTYKEVARTTSNKVVSYTDKSVTKNKSYRYKIKAYRTLGGSVFYSNTSEAVKVKAAKKATKKSSTTTTQ
jgi:fibronectin type 3 domain-containing protein